MPSLARVLLSLVVGGRHIISDLGGSSCHRWPQDSSLGGRHTRPKRHCLSGVSAGASTAPSYSTRGIPRRRLRGTRAVCCGGRRCRPGRRRDIDRCLHGRDSRDGRDDRGHHSS
jgi:hypothetical protein